MKATRYISGVVIALSISASVNAQGDVHYSQFYTAPTFLNPATTGSFFGDYRFFTNYRDQWRTLTDNSYRTITAAFDAIVRPKQGTNNFGVGMTFFTDKAGESGFQTTNYSVSGSYHIEVDKDSWVALGLGLGFHQRSISFLDLYWDEQWNGTEFDPASASFETGWTDKFLVFDLSGGVYYFSAWSDDLALYGGASVGHVNRPNITFLGLEDKLLMKFTIHGGLEYAIPNSKVNILPNLLAVVQGPNQIYNIGTDFKFKLREASRHTVFNDAVSLQIGTYYRLFDAAYFTLGLNWGGLKLAAGYDWTLSQLGVSNQGFGAMEFVLSYQGSIGQSGGISMFRPGG